MGQLDGKIAIVTGGAKGLGGAIVELFVTEGATVVISDLDANAGEALANTHSGRAHFVKHDVSSEDQWEEIIKQTISRFGKFDILINNAGVFEVGNIETQTAKEWRRVNAVIADGTFFGCKHAVLAMKNNGGTIVNIASIASLQGEPYCAAYSAAKGAVEALTRSVAVHCVQSRYKIRCNSIHPGPIATPMARAIPDQMKKAVANGMKLPDAMGAMKSYVATVQDMAPAILYLASDASKWVNGARLVIDNTMSITSGIVPA